MISPPIVNFECPHCHKISDSVSSNAVKDMKVEDINYYNGICPICHEWWGWLIPFRTGGRYESSYETLDQE